MIVYSGQAAELTALPLLLNVHTLCDAVAINGTIGLLPSSFPPMWRKNGTSPRPGGYRNVFLVLTFKPTSTSPPKDDILRDRRTRRTPANLELMVFLVMLVRIYNKLTWHY